MEKYSRIYADINLDCIRKNVDSLMSATKKGTKALAVVKADAYGHGDVAVAKAIYDKVFGYAVATVDEAVNLRENGIDKYILILGYVNPCEYENIINNNINATVFDYETAKELSDTAVKLGRNALCNIKIDTGMRRIGFEPIKENVEVIKNIKTLPNLIMTGMFTHFATADEVDKSKALKQFEKYNKFADALKHEGIIFYIYHCANSAAIIDMPQTDKDMVRLGIAMYGMYPSDEVQKKNVMLFPALELKSHIAMVKKVNAGEEVSYGGTFKTDKNTVIATVEAGYADGYKRALSSKGSVLIHGKRAPIIGRVCMDQFMIDVTEIPDVKQNDVVTLIGKDGRECISVEEISELAGTFNYEMVCSISKRVPRNYYLNNEYIGSIDYFHEKCNLKID